MKLTLAFVALAAGFASSVQALPVPVEEQALEKRSAHSTTALEDAHPERRIYLPPVTPIVYHKRSVGDEEDIQRRQGSALITSPIVYYKRSVGDGEDVNRQQESSVINSPDVA